MLIEPKIGILELVRPNSVVPLRTSRWRNPLPRIDGHEWTNLEGSPSAQHPRRHSGSLCPTRTSLLGSHRFRYLPLRQRGGEGWKQRRNGTVGRPLYCDCSRVHFSKCSGKLRQRGHRHLHPHVDLLPLASCGQGRFGSLGSGYRSILLLHGCRLG